MPTTCRFVLAALLPLFAAAPAFAYITKDNSHLIVEDRLDLPQRGTHATTVLKRFGEPLTRHSPIGQPPISRWDYPGFSVFFEYELALHSVVIKNGEPPVPAE